MIYIIIYVDRYWIYRYIYRYGLYKKKLGTQALLLFKNADTPITNRCIPGTKKVTKNVRKNRKRTLQCSWDLYGSCKYRNIT